MNLGHVAIIGGGPGGLTLARLLQMKGISVTVFERDVDRETRIQGGALDLHDESGLAALAAAGLLGEFKTHYRPGAEKIRVMDARAEILLDEHGDRRGGGFGDAHYRPEIDRGPLREMLLDSLQPGTVLWDRHVVGLEPAGTGWRLWFADGESVEADLVVGVDGANSKIRSYVTLLKPEWVGVTMIEGSIKDASTTAPTLHALLRGGKIFAFDNGQSVILSSKGNGSFGFSVSWKTGEDWVRESGVDFSNNRSLLAWFKSEFCSWGAVWEELFASADTTFIPRPQYCMPVDLYWEAKPNITLLGDAAHWMPPFAGEGVNMAMLDALELSESLTSPLFGTSQAAIADYEKKMFGRFAEIGRMTLDNTNWMHEPHALEKMVTFFSQT